MASYCFWWAQPATADGARVARRCVTGGFRVVRTAAVGRGMALWVGADYKVRIGGSDARRARSLLRRGTCAALIVTIGLGPRL